MYAWTKANRTTLAFTLVGITVGVAVALVKSSPEQRYRFSGSASTSTAKQTGPEELTTRLMQDKGQANSDPHTPRTGYPAISKDDGAAGSGVVSPVLETDPTAPSYDAFKVATVLDIGFDELFAREPVDPTWAAPMQRRIESLAAKDFLAGGIDGQIDSIECRTQICRVVISGADSNSLTEARNIFSLSNPATGRAAGTSEDALTTIAYSIFRPGSRSLEANRKLYPKMRAAGIAWLRKRFPGERPPGVPPIPER